MTERASRERGSVLLHVLVTGVLVALIAASLLRLAMLRYQLSARTLQVTKARRFSEAGLALVVSNWNFAGAACANNVPGYDCGGSVNPPPPGTCGCTCVPTDTSAHLPTIYTCPADGGSCAVSRGGPSPCQLAADSGDVP